MKALAINSFSFQASIPPYNTAYLVGLLQKHRIETTQLDVNLIFWEKLLSVEFLSGICYNKEIVQEHSCDFAPTITGEEFDLLKERVLVEIVEAIRIIRGKDAYNFERFCWAQKVIFDSQTLIYHQFGTFFTTHLPFWGGGVGFNYHTVSNIKKIALSIKYNPLIEICETDIVPRIKDLAPDIVFVEIMFPFDIIGAYTLNVLLKKQLPNVHLCYPGISFDEFNFSRLLPQIEKSKDFLFDFDSVFIFRNDKGLVKWIENLKDNRAEGITNLIYQKEGRILINLLDKNIPYDSSITPNYKDIELKKYFVPENVFVDRLSTRCFWSECSFCSINTHKGIGQLHDVNTTVNKIKVLQSDYNVNFFWFLDEACPISHALKFARAIDKEGLKIYWSLRTRVDSEITYDVLLELYTSGLRELWIGLEHVSTRILRLMNKAHDTENYPKYAASILKSASSIGIGIHFCHIFGFPSETDNDRNEVMAFYKAHKQSIAKAPFFTTYNIYGLVLDSPVYNDHKKYGITSVEPTNNSFTVTNIPYKTQWKDETSNPETLQKISLFCDKLTEELVNPKELEYVWLTIADSPFELLFKTRLKYNPFLITEHSIIN